ncbi:acetyl-CoA C-acetyltransferase [Pseudomonas sp. NBRC 100443]|uniref:acetyl-CoA C-acetyltransferase n=1 Tax=Pseudomonas sp. NBRC 100443 TaxID=1113665 RepID=UPI0024A13D57|nr:acetyl-CoA C-acetyltransferase [Pseudomonas sp. NBRC 100443]GLU37328.1 acetyl-CoA acetyltransferase [Pseudomonas sp. NBRC 100443]
MGEAFIYDHVRSPRGRGRPDGALHEISAAQLASQVLQALARRSDLDTALVDDVILGCAQPVGEQGGNIARAALLSAGYAESVAGQQVHRFCASALEAVNNAAAQIMSGQSLAAIGGGVESMSRTVMGADSGAWSADPWVAYHNYFAPQGIGADLIATLDGYSRQDVDAYALESQRRAAHAWQSGYFDGSIEPIRDLLGEVLLERDEHMRPGTTLEGLASLKPAFTDLGEQGGFDAVALQRYPQVLTIDHVHTGGNSSGIVDGAAAVLLGSAEFGRRIGRKPRARIKGFASMGSEPTIMLAGPAACTEKLLGRLGMRPSDIDLYEINEAFASVVLRYQRALGLDPARVNVNGGAIALGHPLGATGAIILGTLLDELERRDLSTGLITLCAGNGLATATVIERI